MSSEGDRPDPVPASGVEAVLAAFEEFQLVAVGELHRCQEEADFLTALLHHPGLPDVVDDVVVEFGNAFHQQLVDRFVAGEPFANAALRPIWRDAIGQMHALWDAPIYEEIVRTVRAVRHANPRSSLRLLLGDSALDWSTATSEDAQKASAERDPHFARVVKQEVVARGRRALLVAGGFHFVRGPHPTVVRLLERQASCSVFVVLPHCPFGVDRQTVDELEDRLASWPRPSLARLAGTWLGELSARDILGWEMAEATLSDLADGYLYLGRRSELTASRPNPALFHGDPDYLAEINRRERLLHGRALTSPKMLTEDEPLYWPDRPPKPSK